MSRLVCRPWLFLPPVARMPDVRLFSGRSVESSETSCADWKRRPAEVGLYFLTGIGSDSLEELDLLAFGQLHVRLLPVLALSEEPAHTLPFPLAVGHAHAGDLDAEELFDGLADLDLVGRAVHLEADRVGSFLQLRGLLRDQGAADQLLRFHAHPSVSTTRASASCETTTVPWFMTS